ncbi:hypothetical protein LX36DRAFT_644707 [Colletotrichum falcatum]|nr:hypothetical protein LX36DRAFT_644707 [Colletotrichum falcatum]
MSFTAIRSLSFTHDYEKPDAMCNYTRRELGCTHTRWIVSEWCPLYAKTQRRCHPRVTHCEYRGNKVCGDCKPSEPVEWAHMIAYRPYDQMETIWYHQYPNREEINQRRLAG